MIENNPLSVSRSAPTSTLIETEANLALPGGITLYVRAWAPAESQQWVVLCVQGLGGHGGYYQPLAELLAPAGVALVAPDLRGHGRSSGVRGDIDSFARYLDDIEAAVQWAGASFPGTPLILLGESMGASIAIQYLASKEQHPNAARIAGLALLSPVLRPVIYPTLGEAARFLRSLLLSPARPTMAVSGREELSCREQAFNDQLRDDPLFVRYVSVRFLTTLNRWLGQTRRKATQISLPLLVLRGECDKIAHPAGTAGFLRRAATRDQRLVTFPEAYHCLLHDPATPLVISALLSWLEVFAAD